MEPGMPMYSLESVACLLRSYNNLLAPAAPAPAPGAAAAAPAQPAELATWDGARVSTQVPNFQGINVIPSGLFPSSNMHNVVNPLLAALPPQLHCLPPYCHHLPPRSTTLLPSPTSELDIRRRGEKRPIPPELKDEKYFERRRRNNQAAKKSRDARRIREDQIAWRACLLEQENASLRAHVAALRQEALALRSLLAARDEPPAPAPSSTTPD